MAQFSNAKRRGRLVRRIRNRKGQQLSRGEGAYDIDLLSQNIMTGKSDNKAAALHHSIQTKLTMGSPNDAYEKEADKKADQIVQQDQTSQSPPEAQAKEEELQAKPLLQKQEEEEEELQAKPLLQKQEEEEEELQAKPLLQRQEEEEEELQAKPLLQRQEEEEEELQAKPLLQRQEEEEEELQAKPLLQKQEEEEEELQAKPLLQKQEEEEEELQAKPLLQKQEEEEEELQAKPLLQKQEEEEEELQAKPLLQKQEEEEAQAKSTKSSSNHSASAGNQVKGSTTSRLTARKGNGSQLSSNTQSFMESHFKKDFSGVRIHTDNEANSISQSLSAQAFTLGKDIYFNTGKYSPETRQGKHLLAHELTHVVQQNSELNKKSMENSIQRKCKPAPSNVYPKVKFKMFPKIKNNAGLSSFGRTHNKKVKILSNNMRFTEKQICGICGPKNKTESWVIYPAKANIKASIPVSINKSKIKKVGSKGERFYIDKKSVMHTGFYTAADAKKKMMKPVLITVAMTKKHELHHVAHIENVVKKQLKSRHSDIQPFCPYKVKDGKAWKKMMRGGWSGTVEWYSEHATNTPLQEKAARKHSF